MSDIVTTVLPVFALVLTGYLVAKKTSILGEGGPRTLTSFVFYVAVPALLFRIFGQGLGRAAAAVEVALAYAAAGVVVFAVAFALGRFVFRLGLAERAILAMGGTFSNSVLLGLPLIITLFGEPGLATATVIITLDSIVLLPLSTILVEFGGSGSGHLGRRLAELGRSLAQNPVILASLFGLAYGASGLPVPAAVDRFADLLAGAAAPCALFALGATLTRFSIGGNLVQAGTMVLLKMALHPAAVAVMVTLVPGIDPVERSVAVMIAALPVGANVFVLAELYGVSLARTSTAILVSTGLAVFTLSALLLWIGLP